MEKRDEKALIPVPLGAIEVQSPEGVVERATQIAQALAKVVRERNLALVIAGQEYVRYPGLALLGAMLGLGAREVESYKDSEGTWHATAEIIRLADGQVVGRASACCSPRERNWSGKPDHMLRSMALTRAAAKAYKLLIGWILPLAGYSPTPAEEMEGLEENGASQAQPQAQPQAQRKSNHWLADQRERNRFWGIVHKELGLTSEEVHQILGVKTLWDYPGTCEEALEVLKAAKSRGKRDDLHPDYDLWEGGEP